jgi:hypothetical protein
MRLADPLTPVTPPASGVLCVITHRRLRCPAYDICAMYNDPDHWVFAKLSSPLSNKKDINGLF